MGEADLVVRFATSEPGSVDEMYREYGRLVYAVTKRVLGDAAQAEEATRQTFVRAWRLAAGLDPSEALEPWLAGIAASTARDIHEHTRAHDSAATATPDEPGPTGPTPAAERENVVWLVRSALDTLSAEDRELLRLQHDRRLTQRENTSPSACLAGPNIVTSWALCESRVVRCRVEMSSICTPTAIGGPTIRYEMPNSSGRAGCSRAWWTRTPTPAPTRRNNWMTRCCGRIWPSTSPLV
jgi:RNA polymerase sigma factor (sigma-70 family)